MRFLLALALFAACPAAPPPPPPPPSSGGGSQAPPPVTGECATDADCVVSCARKDDCCAELCEPCSQVFTRSGLEAHEQWRAESCGSAQCPQARCAPPKEQTAARCTAGKCTLERTPL